MLGETLPPWLLPAWSSLLAKAEAGTLAHAYIVVVANADDNIIDTVIVHIPSAGDGVAQPLIDGRPQD